MIDMGSYAVDLGARRNKCCGRFTEAVITSFARELRYTFCTPMHILQCDDKPII